MDAVLKKLEVPPTALFSTLGRVAARGIKCLVNAKAAEKWTMELIENVKKGDTKPSLLTSSTRPSTDRAPV